MKKLLIWLAGFIALCLLLTGCDLKEKYERPVEMPLSISAGQKLIVQTEVGSIKVSDCNAGQGSSIKAKITGRADTIEKAKMVAEAAKINVEYKNNDVVIKINKPEAINKSWLSVDYTIEVPQETSLDCRTDVGNANISNIAGDIAVSCDVGSITCENARAKTNLKGNVGNIRLVYAEDANIAVNANLSTDVGNIHFKGPKNMSAKFDAKTEVGSISSSLPLTVQEDFCKKSLSGTVGQGQGNVQIQTDVGSIHIE
ncbi:MAG: DUF4097 family beta strand repeat-containing protein [Sedimentisphaerales bacterium]